MTVDFLPPNVPENIPAEEQVKYLKSYLIQLAEQLNWAFSMVQESKNTDNK